jgi:hypothetical protein
MVGTIVVKSVRAASGGGGKDPFGTALIVIPFIFTPLCALILIMIVYIFSLENAN